MQIFELPPFIRSRKKLRKNQKVDLAKAIHHLVENPKAGELKTGDLAGLRVYKFKMVKQLTLLGYYYEEDKIILTLVEFGSHENFYRDLKNK